MMRDVIFFEQLIVFLSEWLGIEKSECSLTERTLFASWAISFYGDFFVLPVDLIVQLKTIVFSVKNNENRLEDEK